MADKNKPAASQQNLPASKRVSMMHLLFWRGLWHEAVQRQEKGLAWAAHIKKQA